MTAKYSRPICKCRRKLTLSLSDENYESFEFAQCHDDADKWDEWENGFFLSKPYYDHIESNAKHNRQMCLYFMRLFKTLKGPRELQDETERFKDLYRKGEM